MQVKDYIVITTEVSGSIDEDIFSARVRDKLKLGYELYGNMGAVFDAEKKHPIYYQALIKV